MFSLKVYVFEYFFKEVLDVMLSLDVMVDDGFINEFVNLGLVLKDGGISEGGVDDVKLLDDGIIKMINFFFGNLWVEVMCGVMYLYRDIVFELGLLEKFLV